MAPQLVVKPLIRTAVSDTIAIRTPIVLKQQTTIYFSLYTLLLVKTI